MALPEFNEDGNLPPGIHPTDWAGLTDRFGKTPDRQLLLGRLRVALNILHTHGCQRAWIGGSFVTDAERAMGRSPDDVDVCWAMEGVNLAMLAAAAPELHPLSADRAAQRQRFGGDYFGVSEPLMFGVVEQFQRGRQSRRRGIVLLMLEEGANHDSYGA